MQNQARHEKTRQKLCANIQVVNLFFIFILVPVMVYSTNNCHFQSQTRRNKNVIFMLFFGQWLHICLWILKF